MKGSIRRFGDDFKQLARLHADRPALIDARRDATLTYADLAQLVNRAAGLMKAKNLTSTRPVACILPNSIENFVAFLGALQAGAGFAPISSEAVAHEVERTLSLVKPGLALIGEHTGDAIRQALSHAGVEVLTITQDGSFTWLGSDEGTPAYGEPSHIYLTTSGTTGEPKAIVIDADRLWSSGKAFIGQHPFIDHTSRFFNILPMSYLGGLFNLGLIPLAAGGSSVISETFSGRSFLDFWQSVERFEINVLWLVPSIMRGLIQLAERTKRNEMAPPLKLRACLLGTAKTELSTKEAFERLFAVPVLENFALSETTFITSETLGTRHRRVERSVGEALPYAEVGCAHVKDFEEDWDGKLQEIVTRSPFLFLGYLSADGELDQSLDEQGWFHTGDLGHFDEDGRLIIEGRKRDVIKKGGYLVSLPAIEALAESHADVAEAAAVPVFHEFYGENLVLCLRVKSPVGEHWISKIFSPWLHGNLSKHLWPERILIMDDFPRTQAGKVRKLLLAQSVTSMLPRGAS